MARVIWSKVGRAGSREFLKRLAVDHLPTAQKWKARIDRSVEQLELFPESGSPVEDESFVGLREVLVGPYRMIYSFDPATSVCRILFFIHGHRDLGNVIPPDDEP